MGTLYLPLYGEINNGAHRKAADLVGAPALIWHQALWNPAKSEKWDDKEERRKRVSSFLAKLRANLDAVAKKVEPQLSHEVRVAYDDRVRVISLRFVWECVRGTIRIENHTEYVTITSMLDASADYLNAPLGPVEGSSAIRTEIAKYLGYFRAGTHRPIDARPPHFENLTDTYEFIYHKIWDEHFFPEILNRNSALAVIDKNGVIGELPLGARFADFRGLVTCEQYSDRHKEKNLESQDSDLSGLGLEYDPVQCAFYSENEANRGQWQRVGNPGDRWARRRLNNAWPFLSLSVEGAKPPLTGRTEFTVSRLLQGRALYASAMAPQPEFRVSSEPVRPLHFYLHTATQCERQIGRTLDRLCQLGTLRLAAVIALPEFKRVGQELAEVVDIVTSTRTLIHELIQGSKDWDKEKRRVQERGILDKLDDIQKRMSTLSTGRSEIENEGLGCATLEYRLARSRYYREVFEFELRALRTERLEGYQPYDEFVIRRLGSAFKFVEGLEHQVKEMRSEWRALDQLYLTTAVTILTREIDDLQSGGIEIEKSINAALTRIDKQQNIANDIQDTNNKILAHIDGSQREIAIIQLWGERFLLLFLLPYYSASLILHLNGCEGFWKCDAPLKYGATKAQWIVGITWLAFILVTVGRELYRWLRSSSRVKDGELGRKSHIS